MSKIQEIIKQYGKLALFTHISLSLMFYGGFYFLISYKYVDPDILMKKIEVGKSIVLRNIFFDTGKSTLRSESYAELGILYQLLSDNPKMRIEISGHTDNKGSAALNKKLSESRAKSVVDYLISKGIDASRLEYKGYGFDMPIAPNDTEAGRQQNRRTEFKVIGTN